MRTIATTLAAAVFAFSLSARADADPATQRLWKAKCASCHGDAGDPAGKPQGAKMKVRSMADAAWQKEFTDGALEKATLEGLKRDKDGAKQEMKGFKDLKPEQVKALVALMRSFKK